MRYIVHGAAPCTVATKQAMIDWFGPILWEYFAATEGAGASIGPDEWLAHPGSVGRPPTADHVVIRDDDGERVPAGDAGNHPPQAGGGRGLRVLRRPGQDRGDPARRLLRDRRHRLPRRRRLPLRHRPRRRRHRERRREHLPGRGRGGAAHPPAVPTPWSSACPTTSSARRSWPWSRRPTASSSGDALAEELIAFCRERLAHFKCPRSVDVIDRIPRQDNGKLYRNQLRDQYRRDTGTRTRPDAGHDT